MARRIREDREGMSLLRQVISLTVVMGILIGGFLLVYVKQPPPPAVPRTAEEGDTVEIGYVGTFLDTGRVFDTSYRRVAEDNVTYPKALAFSWRANWQSFTFQVGSGSAIKGFDEGVRGMAVGETRRVVVPPEKGYGPLDMSKVFERALLQDVPVRVVMSETAFADKFGTLAQDGLLVADPFWGWNVTVAVSNNIVTTTNSPVMGQRLRPYDAWNAHVEGIDDSANNGTGTISVRHELTAEDAGNIMARDGAEQFIVSSVDLVNGVYVANYNREVVGRTLVFDMTLASIIRR